MPSPAGAYATSGALSTTHYKLEANGALLACLGEIKARWGRKAPSPSKARHDLTLVLYCRGQRLLSDIVLGREEKELFEGEWALPTTVMLAGGGGGGMKERRLGSRACSELFTFTSHPLKLLLINTIRSDLHAAPGTSKAEARWVLALRALGNPTLVSPELLPAVRERVHELLVSSSSPDAIRRLALEATLSLVRTDTSSNEPSSLRLECTQAVLSLIVPPPPSSSSSSSSSRRHSSSRPPLSLTILSALSRALSPRSPLHPVLPSSSERVRLHLLILRQILDKPTEETRRTRYKGVRGGWAIEGVLKGLREELELLRREKKEGELGKEVEEEVGKAVWEVVQRGLDTGGDMSDALTSSALRVLNLLPLTTSPNLSLLLNHVHTSLLRSTSPTSSLFALRALTLLPPSTWATAPPSSSSTSSSPTFSAAPEWGEPAFRVILSGLDNPESSVRLATLALLRRVDGNLVKLQYERLLGSLSSPFPAATGSVSSIGSAGKVGRKTRARVIPLLLETLPYLPFISAFPPLDPLSHPSLPPPTALSSLLTSLSSTLSLSPSDVLPEIILPVLDAVQYEEDGEKKRDFARGLWEGGGWREGATEGVMVAGCIEVLIGEEGGERVRLEEVVKGLAEWLANEDGSTSSDLLSLLHEPFLFALLRLVSLSAFSPSTLSDLHSLLSHPESFGSPVLDLAMRVTTPEAQAERAMLERVGREKRGKSLAEFAEALLLAFGPFSASSGSPSVFETHDSDHPPPSSTTSSSRLYHPPPPPQQQPLRYDPYPLSPSSPPSTSSALASPSSPFSALPTTTTGRNPASSPPTTSLSAAARARELHDLQRERADRGGAGGTGRSLMGAGELALMLSDGARLNEGDETEEEEKGRGGEENALGLETGGEEGEKEKEEDHHPPPSRNLLEDDSLDPFHSGGH
ncbi:hypothetical protein JCM8547_002907 [Rhodosporidiobolus lusitaniae]